MAQTPGLQIMMIVIHAMIILGEKITRGHTTQMTTKTMRIQNIRVDQEMLLILPQGVTTKFKSYTGSMITKYSG